MFTFINSPVVIKISKLGAFGTERLSVRSFEGVRYLETQRRPCNKSLKGNGF